MASTFFERPDWDKAPGLHAFIVGISAYPNLPETTDLLQPAHFEMIRLHSPAITAFRLAAFLKANADRFDVPLATCRVLLTPSADELAVEPALADFAAPDFINFSAAAKAWRADAMRHSDGMTLFYFAGHGLQRVKRDHVLVLHNFNDGIGGSLSNKCINVDHLVDGMAPSNGQEHIARTQLYFYDACRIRPELFQEKEIMAAGNFWDVNTVPINDDRVQPAFFASKPGGMSFGKPGKETLFGALLLKCLRGIGSAAENSADPSTWAVSIESLRSVLVRLIDEANRAEEGNQEAIVQNMDRDVILIRLDAPPDVTVSLKIDPATAAAFAKVSVVDDEDEPLRHLTPFDPNPLVTEPTLRPRLRKTFNITPPSASVEILLTRKV
jgi:hypothetical protein